MSVDLDGYFDVVGKPTACNQSELIRRCTAEEWHEAYKARLIERGVDPAFAQETLEAVMDDLDYTDSPLTPQMKN